MSPAETLRAAARLMREQHGPDHLLHEFWTRLAEWLDEMAEVRDQVDSIYGGRVDPDTYESAINVARQYLGGEK